MLQVRFTVPKDALQLDFVFSTVPGGDGIYDNRGGFDYHLPIQVFRFAMGIGSCGAWACACVVPDWCCFCNMRWPNHGS